MSGLVQSRKRSTADECGVGDRQVHRGSLGSRRRLEGPLGWVRAYLYIKGVWRMRGFEVGLVGLVGGLR